MKRPLPEALWALPLALLDGAAERLGGPLKPPDWAVSEAQRRIVLLLNHVLQQEPVAMERLRRQQGRSVRMAWREWHIVLAATPAGLLELAPSGVAPDLELTLTAPAPSVLVQDALRGDKPALRIEGDVQLAAEVNWLADHVRWDLEEDLARLFGDAPAHAMSQAVRRLVQAIRDRLPPLSVRPTQSTPA